MRKLLSAATAALALTAAAPAAAATQIVTNGILTGATGVNVGGTLYDVSFVDGTCSALFSGCNASADFAFTTQASANLAAQSLLDQVFLDGSNGNFDTLPQNIAGCTSSEFCGAIVPYAAAGVEFSLSAAGNYGSANVGSVFDQVYDFTLSPIDNTGDYTNYMFARFTAQTGAVPEPATWAMMLLGFGGIGLQMRGKRKIPTARLPQLA